MLRGVLSTSHVWYDCCTRLWRSGFREEVQVVLHLNMQIESETIKGGNVFFLHVWLFTQDSAMTDGY